VITKHLHLVLELLDPYCAVQTRISLLTLSRFYNSFFSERTRKLVLKRRISDKSLSLLSAFAKTVDIQFKLSLITDSGLQMLSQNCPIISSVDIRGCNITDLGIGALTKSCKGLQNIMLNCCWEITDSAVELLARECPKLLGISLGIFLFFFQGGNLILIT